MSTLLIHLSDLHLNFMQAENASINDLISAIENNKKFDKVFLIITGDFTNSGSAKQLSEFSCLLKKLIKGLSARFNQDITTILVPGNHDINLMSSDRISQEEIVAALKTGKGPSDSLFKKALLSEKASLKLCQEFGCCFQNGAIGDCCFDTGATRFHFCLINSAPFSSLDYDDKEHHYLPSDAKELSAKPSYGKKTIEILVSHHRPDWFEANSMNEMNDFQIHTASICFFGHEHTPATHAETSSEENVIVSKGGELRFIGNNLVGSFCELAVNDEKDTCETSVVEFDKAIGCFTKVSSDEYPLRYNDPREIRQTYNESTINPIEFDCVHESDVFVMPFLRAGGDQNSITTFDELVQRLNKERKIFLSGYSDSGKSLLCHRLFEHYRSKGWCIYFSCSEATTSNPEKNIKDTFDETYKFSKSLFQDFKSGKIEEKIIIIDDIDVLRTKTQQEIFLDYCFKNFGIVVIALSNSEMKDSKEFAKGYFDKDHSFYISGFSVKQRMELYEKISRHLGITADEQIEKISNAVEASLSMTSLVDMTEPGCLTTLTFEIIKDKLFLERNTSNAFSIVFEHTIQEALTKASSPERLDDYYSVLSLLAFNVSFKKHDVYFDLSDIADAINERRKVFGTMKLSSDETLEALKNSGLIKPCTGKYRFERNSYMAYFASKEVVRLAQKGNASFLSEAITNITFGLNGDILLFSIYELKRIDVFFTIQDLLDKSLKGFEEISFEKKNNPILLKNTVLQPETPAQAENKKRFFDRIDSQEKSQIAKIQQKEDAVYAKTDENSQIRSIQKAYKLIELSCKGLSGFRNELEADDRRLLLDKTLCSFLKLANFLFSFSADDIDEINRSFEKYKADKIKQLENESASQKRIQELQDLNIVHAFYDVLTTWILNVESGMAAIMVSPSSMPFIEELPNNDFCRCLFKLISYSEANVPDKFIETLESLYSAKPTKEKEFILQRVLRVFCIKNAISYQDIKRIEDITKIKHEVLLSWCRIDEKNIK